MKLKYLSFSVLLFVLLLGSASSVSALVCTDISTSLVDSVNIIQTAGKPASDVQISIDLSNRLNVKAFQFFLEYDSTVIHPNVLGTDTLRDSLGIITNLVNFYNIQTTSRVNMTEFFISAVDETDYTPASPNLHRMKIIGLPTNFFDSSLTPVVDSGRGAILNLPMHVDDFATHGTISTISFYTETIFNDSFPPVGIGCQYNQYTDTSGVFTPRLTVVQGNFTVDTAAGLLPVINSFTANPGTIQPGGSSTLSWSVTDADSIVISPGVGSFTSLNSSISVSPTSTTSYLLTAYNAVGQATFGASVTVQSIGSNIAPVVAVPAQTNYTISQGQTVSFSVSATDADNDPITLTAINLPANATFGVAGSVTGSGSVTGNFSFTPNTTQDGVYQVSFQATDNVGGSSNTVVVTITVEAILFDILTSTSRVDASPIGGLAGKKSILFPIDLITSQKVYGVQFDFRYDAQYFTVDSVITTGRTPGFVVYDNIGETPGLVRILTFDMANDTITIDSTNSTAILFIAMSIDSSAVYNVDYPVYIEDGWESIDPDPGVASLPLVVDSGIVQVDQPGDINFDKRVDVGDAVSVVGTILGNYSLTSRQFDAADLVVDLSIDVFDLVGIVNAVFGIPMAPAPGQFANTGLAQVALDYDDVFSGTSDMIMVRSELPEAIAGVELDISYDPAVVTLGKPVAGPEADRLNLVYSDNGHGNMKILLHFTNPFRNADLISPGIADLVEIPMIAVGDIEAGDESQLRLSNALLSTSNSESVRVEGFGPNLPTSFVLQQNYPNPFNPTTTIEFSLGGGDDATVRHAHLDIYNILGQHVINLINDDLTAGNHSIEWNGTNGSGQSVATGIYLYKLQVDDRSETKKMLLLK